MKLDEEAAKIMEAMRNDLIICLVERLGGDVTIPVDEVDTVPGGAGIAMEIVDNNTAFRFKVVRE